MKAGRVALLAALFLSGFAGLCCEIAWIRIAGRLFGATTFGLGTVLAVFFGGLALGSWLFGRVAGKLRRPLVVYGWVEGATGLLALSTPHLFSFADGVYTSAYPELVGNFPLLLFVRFLLVTLVILPPATLMGCALPLFARQFVSSSNRIAADVGMLYGINTAGAVAGCAAAGFLLIPRVGVSGTIALAAFTNLLIAAAVLLACRRKTVDIASASPITAGDDSRPYRPNGKSAQVVHLLFFLAGFVALANEVVWTRYFALVVRNTVYTYTITLLIVLVGIGLGSIVAGRMVDRTSRRAFLFGLFQVGSGLIVMAVLYGLPRWAGPNLHGASIGSTAVLFCSVMLVPSLLSGASFPLAVRMVLDDPRFAGNRVGSMTALNTAGGIGGALLGGFFLLPVLGIARSVNLVSAIALLTGLTAWFVLDNRWGRGRSLLLAGPAIAGWLILPAAFGTHIPEDFLARSGELIDFEEGYESNLAVVETAAGLTLEIDRLWQGMDRKTPQIMAAHIPMALHPGIRKVAGIGIGTGQTFSRFLLYDRLTDLHCVDIEKKLPALIRKHYDSSWLDDPRLKIIVEDGRSYLSHTREKYDLISLELGQTFRPGIAGFYTGDFYRIAAERLESDGLICQFVPIGLVGYEEFRGMIRTFIEVFPASTLWFNRNELILVGTAGGEIGIRYTDIAGSLARPAIHSDLKFAYWGGPSHWLNRADVFLGGFLAGPRALQRLAAGGEVYHDDRPILEYAASRFHGSDEEKIARELLDKRESVDAVLVDRLPSSISAAAGVVQQRNIGDIVASFLLRESGRAISAGAVEDAGRILETALTWNGANRKVNNNLGLVSARRGRGEDAIRHFSNAVLIDPGFAEARLNLANALSGAGRREEAIDHLIEVVRLRPAWEGAARLLAQWKGEAD